MHEDAHGLIYLGSVVEIIALLSLLSKFLHDTQDEPACEETKFKTSFYLV